MYIELTKSPALPHKTLQLAATDALLVCACYMFSMCPRFVYYLRKGLLRGSDSPASRPSPFSNDSPRTRLVPVHPLPIIVLTLAVSNEQNTLFTPMSDTHQQPMTLRASSIGELDAVNHGSPGVP